MPNRADFTDNVSAFIELDSYGDWGDGFRSNYLTGVDSRPAGTNSVEVYQAYIEEKEMWGTGLKARIGRQEIKLGSGWLIGAGNKAPYFYGLSFDALRLTYATDQFSIDGIAAKLAENSPASEDGDIDLYGLYGSYLGIENITLDAYALMVRDAANNINDPRIVRLNDFRGRHDQLDASVG
ncbi:MAG: alginate export family protein, partial [Candidatus Hydrogenedentes bacterium]|nr:alginate export family protein [Candidatus Hydrogenedentota bacterium]